MASGGNRSDCSRRALRWRKARVEVRWSDCILLIHISRIPQSGTRASENENAAVSENALTLWEIPTCVQEPAYLTESLENSEVWPLAVLCAVANKVRRFNGYVRQKTFNRVNRLTLKANNKVTPAARTKPSHGEVSSVESNLSSEVRPSSGRIKLLMPA